LRGKKESTESNPMKAREENQAINPSEEEVRGRDQPDREDQNSDRENMNAMKLLCTKKKQTVCILFGCGIVI
jgi:hypothetical protein